jgi:hypothetical protein
LAPIGICSASTQWQHDRHTFVISFRGASAAYTTMTPSSTGAPAASNPRSVPPAER